MPASIGILQDWVRGAPDLVVEVLSPDCIERDRIIKRDLYCRNGVREYWIVDPEARTCEVFTLVGGDFRPDGYFEKNDVLVSSLLEDFRPTISQLFPDGS